MTGTKCYLGSCPVMLFVRATLACFPRVLQVVVCLCFVSIAVGPGIVCLWVADPGYRLDKLFVFQVLVVNGTVFRKI